MKGSMNPICVVLSWSLAYPAFALPGNIKYSQDELTETEGVLVSGVAESAIPPAAKYVERCGKLARDWDATILRAHKAAPSSVSASFSREADCGFDVISYLYSINGKGVATRQMLWVWSVTISDQDLTGSNEQAAQKVTAIAREWLRDFENRTFRYAFESEGKRGFCLTVPIPRQSTWHDTVKVVVNVGSITFVCLLKRYSDDMPTEVTARTFSNRSWFFDMNPMGPR